VCFADFVSAKRRKSEGIKGSKVGLPKAGAAKKAMEARRLAFHSLFCTGFSCTRYNLVQKSLTFKINENNTYL